MVALSTALQGCMFSETPAPSPQLTQAVPEEEPFMSDLVGPSDLEGAIIQAQTFRRAGDFEGATRTLSQLVLVAPDDPRVLGEYGKTLVAKGQTEDAIAFLNRAIELNPSDWTFYSAQGVAFDQMRNFAAANIAYQRALALRPGEPSVLSNAGLSRMQAGDLANAQILLSRAIEQGGTDPRIARNLAIARDLAAERVAGTANPPAPPSNEQPSEAPAAQENATPNTIVAEPADSGAAIPGAVERNEIPAPAPRTSAAVQALAADPTVFMQRIPDPDPVPEPEQIVANSAPVSETETGETAAEDDAVAQLRSEQLADASQGTSLRRLSPTD
jgi:Flp pilus assembly protein TadD